MLQGRQNLVKWGLYGLFLCVFCILQISLPLRAAGVHAIPLLPMAISAAVFEGPRGGAVYGFIAGLLYDAFTPGIDVFFSVYLLLVCFTVGIAVRRWFRISFVTALVWSSLAHVGACLLYFLFFILIPGRAGPMALVQVAFPELLLTIVYLPLAYIISKGIHKRIEVKY